MNRIHRAATRTLQGCGLAFIAFASACSGGEIGSAERPFTMYLVPSVDSEPGTVSTDTLTDFVEEFVSQRLYGQAGGFHVESAFPSSYVAAVEAFGAGSADFAALDTFSYILAHDVKEYPVDPVLRVVRGEGETSSKAQILAHVDSGIESLKDIAGKRFAYTDRASASGYLLPAKLFERMGIALGETIFASTPESVVTQIYEGQVDAGATYYDSPVSEVADGQVVQVIRDARARVKARFPDVEDKVRIVGFTMEAPNAPWVLRSNVYGDASKQHLLREAVRDALLEFAQTDAGQQVLEELFGVTGLAEVDASAYDEIRAMVLASDVDLEHAAR